MKRIWLGVVGIFAVGLVVGYGITRAVAYGVPQTNALTYTGTLYTFGQPDNSTHSMSLALFVSGASSSACGTSAAPVQVSNGSFSMPMPPACVTVIHQNPNVDVQVTIDGVAMSMQPLAAVPYALEADTASNAAPGSPLATQIAAAATGNFVPEDSSTGEATLPVGTTTQRAGTPAVGMVRYNSTLGALEYYSPNGWQLVASVPAFNATGGTITQAGGLQINTFTGSGTFTPNSAGTVQVLVVAGGGAGGRYGGGGGGGGVIYNAAYSVTAQPYAVTVGAGGASWIGDAQSGGNGGSGTNSSFGTITTTGGGGGGNYGNNSCSAGAPGGSGGGGGCNNVSGCTFGNGTAGQGFNGSAGGGGGYVCGAGGGAGQPGATQAQGTGGNGLLSAITGTATYYGGGGGGGGSGYGTTGTNTGGAGGGGHGAIGTGAMTPAQIDGAANTGGGGGGNADNSVNGTARTGAGGSGIVIIAYPL